MFGKQSSKRHLRAAKPRRLSIAQSTLEMLEDRALLAGDFSNSLIDESTMSTLIDGLANVADWADSVNQVDLLADPLGFVVATDGQPLTVSSLFDLQQSLDDKLVQPVRAQLESSDPATRDTDSLVLLLDSLPYTTLVDGGETTNPTEELRFEVSFTDAAVREHVNLEVGAAASALGLEVTSDVTANLTVSVQYDLQFGVLLDSSLSFEQAFFIRASSITLSTDVHLVDASVDLAVGIVEAAGTFTEIDLDFDLELIWNDLIPDANDNITLAELNGFDVREVVDVTVGVDAWTAALVTNPTVGGWTAPGTPTVVLNGRSQGDFVPEVVTNGAFDPLLAFARIDADAIVEGFGELTGWLQRFGNSTAFYIDLPMLETRVAAVFDPSRPLQQLSRTLVDLRGQPVFRSTEQLETLFNADFHYDPLTQRLAVPLHADVATQVTTGEFSIGGNYGHLADIEVQGSVDIQATGSVSLEFVIDLNQTSTTIATQFSVAELSIDASVDYTAAALEGTARYGIVGLSFDGAAAAGSLDVSATVVNPYGTGAEVSLQALNDGLLIPNSLLGSPLAPLASASLDMGALQVIDNLFSVASVSLGLEQTSFGSIPQLDASGASFLNRLAAIDIDFAAEQLLLAAQQTLDATDLVAGWNELVGMVPLDMDVSSLFIDPTVFLDLLTQSIGDGQTLLLQDLPAAIAALPQLMGFSPRVTLEVDRPSRSVTLAMEFSADVPSVAQEFGLQFGAGLGDAIGTVFGDLGEFAGTHGSVATDVNAQLQLDLLIDVSSANAIQAYVLDSSGATVELYINDQVELAGSLGILGAEFSGTLIVADNVASPSPNRPAVLSVSLADTTSGRYALDGSAIDVQASAAGELLVDYEFTSTPNVAPEVLHLAFNVSDLGDALNSLTVTSSPNFQALVVGIQDLSENLAGLPSALLKILEAIGQATDDGIFGIKLPVIGNLLGGSGNFLNDLHDKLALGLTGLTQFDEAFLEGVLEGIVADVLHLPDDRVDFDTRNPNDILLSLDFSGTLFELSKEYVTNLGFPALGAELNANFEIIGTYDAVFTFGVDRQGVYLITEHTNPALEEQIGINLDVNVVPLGNGPEFVGRLGFVQVDVDNVGSDTVFHASFDVDLTEPSGDGKLRVSEALNSVSGLIDFDNSGISGGTGSGPLGRIQLGISIGLGEWSPSLEATLEMDWHFTGFNFTRDTPDVSYRDVGIGLGGFLSDTLCPFFETLAGIFSPFDPVLDVFETEVPIVSDYLEGTTILTMAEAAEALAGLVGAENIREKLDTVTTLVRILDTIDDLGEACSSGEEGVIQLGTLSLQGIAADVQEIGLAWLQDNVDLNVQDPMEQLEDLATELYEATQDVSFTGGRFEFPIFEQPLSAFEWLLGIRQIPIVTVEVAELQVDLELPLVFQLGPIYAGLEGGLEVQAGLAVGYDTQGFSDLFESGDPLDLFNGFYISDTTNADGTGSDRPEISLGGSLDLVAGLGFKDFGAGVEGGLSADVELDLLDHNGDGRVRGSELKSDQGCMTISGGVDITAGLELSAFGIFDADIPFGSHEIANFNYTVYCVPVDASLLADLNEDTGVLTLFVGDDADLRLLSPNVIDEFYQISADASDLIVAAFGATQTFPKNQVSKIVANAGSGNDTILIDASVTVEADLDGGSGDDKLVGGGGDDTLLGGDGDDDLYGNGGHDTISTGDGLNTVDGGEGNDTIDGGDDRDILLGGSGIDTIHGLAGDDVIDGGGDGDFLYGDEGFDDIDGDSGNDTIDGGDGDDDLFGGSGRDTIHGGLGADYLDGGADGDTMFGENGPDIINGGEGNDTIEGGAHADTINGGSGNDTIDGGALDDTIHGDDDDDTIVGGTGDDLLYGDDGDDTVDGQAGRDTIEGGNQSDILIGGSENDTLWGGAGNDTLEGGSGNDLLYGEGDDDHIYGNQRNALVPATLDDDTIYGGAGNDVAFGQDGVDLIFGENGKDTLHGGAGADVIYGGPAADKLYGDENDDLLFGEAGNDHIEGGSEADVIRGMTGHDTLFGDGGDDQVFGDDGNDVMEGGNGSDLLEGGRGNDRMFGNAGVDRMYGQLGNDTMYGGAEDDVMYGAENRDVMYGEGGQDRMYGGSHNDTMRGGANVDVMYGDGGDDLMIGNAGDDSLYGGLGNDVLRGSAGNDHLEGQVGNDRLLGDDGDDQMLGQQGNDTLEGGRGNDTLRGAEGDDQLHGDEGVDDLDGGTNNDYLWDSSGIGNRLRGGDGDDTIVGADDGHDDPVLTDAVYFGDIIFGGNGNDTIDGLGGADWIDAGLGNDIVRGGVHGDLIIGGPNVATGADQDVIYGGLGIDTIRGGAGADQLLGGPEVDAIVSDALDTVEPDGDAPAPVEQLSDASSPGESNLRSWTSLDGSAATDGLSQVGGFEQASYAVDDGVYVAWVDIRNGNSEIYVAHRGDLSTSGWEAIAVGGGGLSNDPEASRRPSIVKSGDHLLVSWTRIDSAGNSTIQFAVRNLKLSSPWIFVTPPGLGGNSDHSQLAVYPSGALLGWIDESSNGNRIGMSQYVACDHSFLSAATVYGGQADDDIPIGFELDTDNGAAGLAILLGHAGESIKVAVMGNTVTIPYACPNPSGGPNITIELETPVIWTDIGTFTNEQMDSPTIALGGTAKRADDQGQFEVRAQYAFDVYVAWDFETDLENQVEGRKTRRDSDGTTTPWTTLTSQLFLQRTSTNDTVSATVGFAAVPRLAASDSEIYLAWMDDSVHQNGGDGRTSVYVVSAGIGASQLGERVMGEASGRGISVNGGSLQDLEITVERTELSEGEPPYLPYVAWTDAYAGQPQIYVRHDEFESSKSINVELRSKRSAGALV